MKLSPQHLSLNETVQIITAAFQGYDSNSRQNCGQMEKLCDVAVVKVNAYFKGILNGMCTQIRESLHREWGMYTST
jgi:hypothetical protein